MNTSDNDRLGRNSNAGPASATVDATLRLFVHVPVPEGIEERVHERLRSAPRRGELRAWPVRVESNWMRSAAAAAIVAIVAGGGWGVYSHVGQQQVVKVIAAPAPAGSGGGFSSAGAMRTPQTVHGPVLKNPAMKSASKKNETAPVEGQDGRTDTTPKPSQPAIDGASK